MLCLFSQRFLVLLLLAMAAGSLPPAGGETIPSQDAPLLIMASIFPLGDVATQIGGPDVRIEIMVPASRTAHDFEPSPAQVELLAKADMLLTVGLGIDLWAQRSAAASGNRRLGILEFGSLIPSDSTIAGDPHIWLDPILMERFAHAIADSLGSRRPANAPAIQARAASYIAQLQALDHEYRQRLATLRTRDLVVMHAAFGYLAARYGLRQIAVFQTHMEEPDPRTLEQIITFIRENSVPVLFVQPQMPPDMASALKEETGVRLEILDPQGNPSRPGYDSYLSLMGSNLAALTRGLGG